MIQWQVLTLCSYWDFCMSIKTCFPIATKQIQIPRSWLILNIALMTEVERIIFFSPTWRRTECVHDLKNTTLNYADFTSKEAAGKNWRPKQFLLKNSWLWSRHFGEGEEEGKINKLLKCLFSTFSSMKTNPAFLFFFLPLTLKYSLGKKKKSHN